MQTIWKTLGCALAMTCLVAAPAAAEAPVTANAASVFGQLDYGIWMGEDSDQDYNAYGVGLSVGGGYTLDVGVYIGGRFDYFLGDSESAAGVEFSTNIYQFGVEAGYDLGLSPQFVLRPQLGLGLATMAAETSFMGTTMDDSEGGFAISPGVAAIMDMGGFHIRGDLRYNILNLDISGESFDASGLLIGVGAGATF